MTLPQWLIKEDNELQFKRLKGSFDRARAHRVKQALRRLACY